VSKEAISALSIPLLQATIALAGSENGTLAIVDIVEG
jgi:hypothetical protein